MATINLESQSNHRTAGERAIVAAMLRLSAIPKHDWEGAIQQILQVESEVLGLERVSYWSIRDNPSLIHCDMGYIAGPRAFERGAILLEAEHPRYFTEIARGDLLVVENAASDARVAELRDYTRNRQISSMLDVPVYARGARVGVLCHEHTGPIRRWSESDIDFVLGTAQTVATALEAHACGAAEERRRRATFLDQATLRLARARDVSAVAQQAVAMAVAELADATLLDVVEDGQLVRIGFASRTDRGQALLEQLTRSHPPFAHGPHPAARVLRLGQSLLVPAFSRARTPPSAFDAGELRLIDELGVRSMMAIPLVDGERALGVMTFFAVTMSFDQGDLRFAEGFVERVTMALENARLHQRAETAIRARDEFIAVAAHELHGPLTSLQLSAESLAASVITTPEVSAKMSQTVVRQTQRLNRLVDHMLDASRIMTKRLSLVVNEVDLSKLVQEIAGGFVERCERAGSALELDIEPGVVGYWDGDRLAQVVSNLLDNAVKFGTGKPIEVTLQSKADQAVLRVTDHGIGVPADRIGSLFDPFVRAVSPRSFGGLGLGLFMAKAVVDAHSGQLEVSSQPSEGSTFTVRLPRGAAGALGGGDGEAA